GRLATRWSARPRPTANSAAPFTSAVTPARTRNGDVPLSRSTSSAKAIEAAATRSMPTRPIGGNQGKGGGAVMWSNPDGSAPIPPRRRTARAKRGRESLAYATPKAPRTSQPATKGVRNSSTASRLVHGSVALALRIPVPTVPAPASIRKARATRVKECPPPPLPHGAQQPTANTTQSATFKADRAIVSGAYPFHRKPRNAAAEATASRGACQRGQGAPLARELGRMSAKSAMVTQPKKATCECACTTFRKESPYCSSGR